MAKNVIVDSGFNPSYHEFLKQIFKEDIEIIDAKNYIKFSTKERKEVGSIDLILFTGGEDVDPSIYLEEKGKFTYSNERRDKENMAIFDILSYKDTPKLGICRGAQFLTVANGGRLVQHVTGHTSSHLVQFCPEPLRLINGSDTYHSMLKRATQLYGGLPEFTITSTHHQMMFPFNLMPSEYSLLGWSKFYLSDTYLDGKNEEIELPSNFLEPEIVYYNNTKSLAIQGHPEFANCPINSKDKCIKIIKSTLFNNFYLKK